MTDAFDNFNRADGSLGSNWTNLPHGGGIGDTLAIVSNTAATAIGWGLSFYSDPGSIFQDDQHSQCTLVSGIYAGVTVRNSGSANCYLAFLTTGNAAVQIWRIDAGSFNYLGGVDTGTNSVLGDTIKLSVIGTTLTAFRNGVSWFTTSDATYATGRPGIATNTGALDDWSAGPINSLGIAVGTGNAVATGASKSVAAAAAAGVGTATAVVLSVGINSSIGFAVGTGAANAVFHAGLGYYAGLNYPWNAYAADFGTGGFGHLTDIPTFTSDFAAFHAQSVSTVRWWLFGDGRYCPVFNPDGTVAGLNSGFLTDLDQVLQIAANNNIYLLLTLIDFTMFNNPTFSGTVQQGGHADIIKDVGRRQFFMDNALKPLLQHIAASPNKNCVLGYDIINEPEDQIAGGYNNADFFTGPAQFALADVQAFVAMAANYIHTYSGGGLATLGSAMPIWTPLWVGLGLDFHQAHYYDWMDFSGPGSGLTPVANITGDGGFHLDAPCILGEFATAVSGYGFTDTTVHSARWYLDTIFARGYIGVLGWSLHAGDSPSNWAAFQPVFSNWVQQHSSIIAHPTATVITPPPVITPPDITPTRAMTVPSASNFKFKFSQFRNMDDGEIEFAIEEAVVACGGQGNWIDDANQTLALYYYAAHLLQVAIMRASSGTGQIISSERTPDLSVSYAVPLQGPIDFTMTIYGERFLGLVRKNFPAVLTVGSAVAM